MGVVRHTMPAIRAFCAAPMGATKRVTGLPDWVWSDIRALPVGHSVELQLGNKTREGCARMGAPQHTNPIESYQWGLLRSSPGATKRVRGVQERA
eukprot:6654353-Pyramimonas_sp.AAC.1